MKYSQNIYVSQDKNLTGFRAILNSYIEIEAHYTKQFCNDDFAFAYGERACVATFAAAAIRNGWAALCEHEHQKISKYDGRENSWGRGDIYLAKKNNAEFCGEAKYKIITETATNKGWQGNIRRTMEAAEEDIKNSVKSRRGEDERGLAISFFCFLQDKRNHNAGKNWLEAALEYITNLQEHVDAYAHYVVPKKVLESANKDWDGGFPIGFIIVLKRFGQLDA